ncbi:MAG: GGDEF domain-containing protein [Bauldia sp.]|nr:GGDEF domain-containing protein [Bauldia sp.]
MLSATSALVVNIAVAGLFAACFACLALMNPNSRRVLWFAVAYAVGLLTPLSELLIALIGGGDLLVVASFASFLGALLLMVAALAVFYGRRPPWLVIGALFAVGMAGRLLLWGAPRGEAVLELAYQAPFALAVAAASIVVFRHGVTRLDRALAIALAVTAGHFVIKGFLAAAFGSGATAGDYAGTTYALLSQAITGILLIAAGLLVVLAVVQRAMAESRSVSETDPLSGLANRRGFDARAAGILDAAARAGLPAAILLFDLDRFKQINDTHGHGVGDQVIAAFAALLRDVLPERAVAARIGGEEFAVVVEPATLDAARLVAASVRLATGTLAGRDLPRVTVSAGVAAVLPAESLGSAIRRADQALYRAKQSGRDRVCVADPPAETAVDRGFDAPGLAV